MRSADLLYVLALFTEGFFLPCVWVGDSLYHFSLKSLNKLRTVHPDLQRVAFRALELSPRDFGILCGARGKEVQEELVKRGVSKTIHSKHLVQADGWAHAIDIAVYMDGEIVWENMYFRPVLQAFVDAAIELGVKIRLGHLWQSFEDSGHIELAV
jgi:peptidoglycan L-alanyl-D-glutamate endopeptidase CwlK